MFLGVVLGFVLLRFVGLFVFVYIRISSNLGRLGHSSNKLSAPFCLSSLSDIHIKWLGEGREERVKKRGGRETRHIFLELKSPASASPPFSPPSPCLLQRLLGKEM